MTARFPNKFRISSSSHANHPATTRRRLPRPSLIPPGGILYVSSPPNLPSTQKPKLSRIISLLVHSASTNVLLALQTFIVLFLALHDWVPLGTLNNLPGVRAANPGTALFTTTLLSAAPYAFGLAASIIHLGEAYPDWLLWWLWISYVLLFLGQLRAWWIPLPPPPRTRTRRALSTNVWRHSRPPPPAQRHPAEHAPHTPAHSHRRSPSCSGGTHHLTPPLTSRHKGGAAWKFSTCRSVALPPAFARMFPAVDAQLSQESGLLQAL